MRSTNLAKNADKCSPTAEISIAVLLNMYVGAFFCHMDIVIEAKKDQRDVGGLMLQCIITTLVQELSYC